MNEVATVVNKYPALADKQEELSIEDELFSEELEALNDLKLKFPKVKLGASGNGKLEVPNPDSPDDGMNVKELTGVIVCCLASRAKWNEGDLIPECASVNGKCSITGKPCSACKFSKFTRDNTGKIVRPACKESRNLYIVTESHALPLQFIVPPSGVSTYDKFARDLLSNRQTQLGTIVRIGVDVVTNAANQKYNKAKFESIGRVEPEYLQKLMDLRKQIVDYNSNTSMEDFAEEETSEVKMTEVKDGSVDDIF